MLIGRVIPLWWNVALFDMPIGLVGAPQPRLPFNLKNFGSFFYFERCSDCLGIDCRLLFSVFLPCCCLQRVPLDFRVSPGVSLLLLYLSLDVLLLLSELFPYLPELFGSSP